VPSLNDRVEDIPLLIDHFLTDICAEYGIQKKELATGAMKELKKYNWTGNIRELRNVVERLVILSGKTIGVEDVEAYVIPNRING
jgi:DNA-binding NtrC family response regulator